jgi:hypothetical protein
MHLIFEQGDYDQPTGHALVSFRAEDGAILATYVSVPPISFDLSKFVPGFLAGAMQGMDLDLASSMVAAPMPPIPEEVASVEYLRALAARRRDDLVFAGATMRGDPMRLAAETAEAAREYGDLYGRSPRPEPETSPVAFAEFTETADGDVDRFRAMTEQEQLNELTALTGRLRDSLRGGAPDPDVERQMRLLVDVLPAKYRARSLMDSALIPGDRGQRLAELYLERSYKLFREDYLDLERIDREIEAL